MTLFAVAALLAPVVGPHAGGIHNRQLRVAMDFLYQYAHRSSGIFLLQRRRG